MCGLAVRRSGVLKVGSLFSGIEGFGLGFRRVGAKVLWHVEKDDACQTIIARHFGGQAFGDVHSVGRHNLRPVDLVCGGFPCQDLSVAGQRAGLAGERSGLWYEFHRVLAELAPEWVVIENVGGLLTSQSGRDMAIVLGGLAQLGYWWAYRVLDSQYFGLAQRRDRVFIVGHLGNRAYPAKVLFEPESLPGHPAPSRQTRQEVAGTLGGGSGERGWAQDTERMTFIPEVLPALTAGSGSNGMSPGHNRDELMIAHALTSGGSDASEDGTGRGAPLVVVPIQDGRDLAEKGQNGLGVGRAGDPAYTVDTTGAGAVATLTSNGDAHSGFRLGEGLVGARRLTPLECERLQGFPDGWTSGLSDSTRYRLLGNAVSVPVAEWGALRITEVGNYG